jgi:hypothetical protein
LRLPQIFAFLGSSMIDDAFGASNQFIVSCICRGIQG